MTETAFLDASRAAGERAQRRLRLGFAAVSLLLATAVVAGLVALDQRGNARTEARVAESQRLGAQALTEPTLDRSLLLARQAMALDDSASTHNTLLSALLRSPAALGVMRGPGGRMLTVAAAPDGRILATGDNRGRLAIFDAATRKPRGVPFRTAKPIQVAAFSPDGSRLVVASGNVDGGSLDVFDGRTFRPVSHHRLPHLGEEVFGSVAFTRDSREFVLAYERYRAREEPLGIVQRWDARRGQPLGDVQQVPGAGGMDTAFDRDGRLVTVSLAAREAAVRDPGSLQPLRRLPIGGQVSATAVSPDGRRVALAAQDGSVRVLSLATGRSRLEQGRHAAPVESAAFTPDGRSVVTGADDGTVILHALGGGAETFEGHAARVAALAPSPDGMTGYSASLDGTVIAWDLDGARRLGRRFGAESGGTWRLPSEALAGDQAGVGANIGSAPGGNLVAIPRPGGIVSLMDTRTLHSTGRLRISDDPNATAWGSDISPDGRTIATASSDGYLRFWDARSRAPLSRPLRTPPGWPVWGASFSGDGRLLALVGGGGGFHVHLWDTRRHVKIGARSSYSNAKPSLVPHETAMRPDGKVVVVPVEGGPRTGYVDVLAVPSLRVVKRIPLHFTRFSRFSRDGRLLAIGDYEGVVRLYDGRTFEQRGRALRGHTGGIFSADFSPDRRMLVTGAADGTVRLWDTTTGDLIGAPLPGIPNVPVGAAFTRGGTHVAAVYDGGRGYLWDVRPSSWARRACAVAGRPLTRAEWKEALPDRKYAPSCA